jgi:hypothetical protein
MESICLSPDQDTRVAGEVARASRYLAPAPAAAVMREQMEYLMAHAGSSCHPGCPDCTRLEQVKRHLLQPFNWTAATRRKMSMFSDAQMSSKSECAVCYSTHDDEIHEATLRIHRWFRGQVTHNFEDVAFVAPELQPERFATEPAAVSAA